MNNYTFRAYVSSLDSSAGSDDESLIELDSHANMCVVGRNAYVINYFGKTAEFIPFKSSYDALKNVPLVDAIIAYNCQYSGKTYLLVLNNDLLITTMPNNLIAPLIPSEANLIMKNMTKIQVPDTDVTDHLIWFPDSLVWTTL